MIAKLVALWNKVPAPVQKWLKGAEAAVVSALVASFAIAPFSDFTTKKGVAEFAAGIASVAYGALRLYMTQSPIQNVVKQVVKSDTLAVGDVIQTATVSVTTNAPPQGEIK